MAIQISVLSQVPIYEQIKIQLREQILSGELAAGTQLPSIRVLSKELKVGIITSKRAYDDLCDEGFLISRAGIGVFVAEINTQQAKDVRKQLITDQLCEIKQLADESGLNKDDLHDIIDRIYGGTDNEQS